MILSDFHFHSKYSRATSKRNDLKTLSQWAKYKGIHLMGTSDFTHPKWLKELKENLKVVHSDNSGTIYQYNGVRYVFTTEVSTVYMKDKMRKVHHVIIAPDVETVEQINDILGRHNDLTIDGRPTLSMSCSELVEKITSLSNYIEILPAHAWTPWFGVFGSKSGFDSLEEAYEDMVHKIHALETGLSSDPQMNWRLSTLDRLTLVSFSDAHSPENLGREMTIFELEEDEISYSKIIEHIRTKKVGTVEFYPEEGKYHWDGHRNCGVSLPPAQSKKYHNLCPVCGKKLTIGVMHRVESLADRKDGFVPSSSIPFRRVVPLREIIAEALQEGAETKKVKQIYRSVIYHLGGEIKVLLEAPYEEIKKFCPPLVMEGIKRVREEKVNIKCGYDGVYGKVSIFGKEERGEKEQLSLF